MSYDQSVDDWTAQFFSNNPVLHQPMPNYLNGSQRPVLSAPASLVDTSPPVADVKMEENQGVFRKIRMNLRSQRNANALILTLGESVEPVSVRFGTRDIAVRRNPGAFVIVLLGMGTQGADLHLTVKAHSGLSFWLMDRSFGLPTQPLPRPDKLIATEGSDVTLVCRKYSL